MKMRVLFAVAVATWFLTSALQAGPDPKADFAKADAALNAVWAKVRSVLSASEFNEIKEDQRTWIDYRDQLASSPVFNGMSSDKELPPDNPEYLCTATELTLQRSRWLEALLQAPAEMLTGEWSDSYGGHLEIVEQEEGFLFSMSCVRGHSSHVGEISGRADWASPIGWFKASPGDAPGEPAARLSFILKNNRLEIKTAHTSSYHGARAYFDGLYVKVAKLSPARQKELAEEAKASPAN